MVKPFKTNIGPLEYSKIGFYMQLPISLLRTKKTGYSKRFKELPTPKT